MKNYRLVFLILFVLLSNCRTVSADSDIKNGIIIFSRYTDNYWQIWAQDVTTKKEIQLTHSPVDKRAPQCEKTGQRMLYRTANSEVFLLDINTAKEEKLLSRFGTIMDQKWSSTGAKIAFARLRSDPLDDSEIWISDIDGAQAVVLTNDAGLQYNPVFSPDAKSIVFVSQSARTGGHNLWMMDDKGEHKKQLTRADGIYDLLPDVSPDGQSIVFSSNRNGNFDIWLFDIKSGALRPLTIYEGLDTSPAFSPDGKKIVFTSTRGEGKQIWLMDSAGNNLSRLTLTQSPSQEPAWCDAAQDIFEKKELTP